MLGWNLTDGFKALDHPARVLILTLLSENGPMRYNQLSTLVRLKGASMGYHMLVLRPYVVKNNDGLYELNELGKHLSRLATKAKQTS